MSASNTKLEVVLVAKALEYMQTESHLIVDNVIRVPAIIYIWR